MRESIVERSASSRVLVSGDQSLVRTALGCVVTNGGLTVADECLLQPEALRRLAPGADIVVMDLDLDTTRLTRMERLDLLLAAASPCPVLIVTSNEDPSALGVAMRQGAAGVVLKNRPADVFLRAIRAVLAGGAWMERSAVASMFPIEAPDRREALTRREREIVQLVSEGLQNKVIAERLSITHTTVRHHLTSIFDKLSVTNRLELMRYAYDEGRRKPHTQHN